MEDRQIITPQSTQIYTLINDLMGEVRVRYANSMKSARYLTYPQLFKTLAEMSGDYCMAFTTKDMRLRLEYFNRLRCRYYQAEAMFVSLCNCKDISQGHLGNLSKTKLTPLIKQINGLIRKHETTSYAR